MYITCIVGGWKKEDRVLHCQIFTWVKRFVSMELGGKFISVFRKPTN
jgi:hypothetical protein